MNKCGALAPPHSRILPEFTVYSVKTDGREESTKRCPFVVAVNPQNRFRKIIIVEEGGELRRRNIIDVVDIMYM